MRREKRKELVALYHNGGMPDTRIATVLGVHRNTVKADRLELKIPRFSTICDVELANKIYQISQDIHAKVGKDTIDGQLLRQGHFVQPADPPCQERPASLGPYSVDSQQKN